MKPDPESTTSSAYTRRLQHVVWWKRLLDVQAPYRWNLRRLELGFTLDIGSGIGRNLLNLGKHGVGVDHNPHSVEVARRRGLEAYTTDEFLASPHARPERFDSLLAAHVLGHMRFEQAVALVAQYLVYLRSGGRVVLITPQEAGFASDPTHVARVGFAELAQLFARLAIAPERSYSFPFPRPVGRVFRHNEFVAVGRKS